MDMPKLRLIPSLTPGGIPRRRQGSNIALGIICKAEAGPVGHGQSYLSSILGFHLLVLFPSLQSSLSRSYSRSVMLQVINGLVVIPSPAW
jgi:hypothetical protein